MDLNKVNKMYFLGIGGIGMSALARYFLHLGKEIYGYDLASTPLTNQLEDEGMIIHFEEDISKIPTDLDLVIYTPAIPAENTELIYLLNADLPILKRAELAGKLSESYFTVAVAGTHGKTSICAMTAHLLKSSGINTTAIIGGILNNYKSNLVVSDHTDCLIIEADEFDRSFLQLHPNIAIISSMDADHLDIYHDKQSLSDSFQTFANNLKEDGLLIVNQTIKDSIDQTKKTISYGISEKAMMMASNIHVEDGKFVFDLQYENETINGIRLAVPGYHYVENALAAAVVGMQFGLDPDQIKEGLESFEGVERRFEFRINTDDKIFIDDYAHHPEEIRVTIEAVKTLFPDKKITGIFQPHLFSRTNDFAAEFAESLEPLDEVILLPIYPAREKPVQGITSTIIFDRIKNPNKQLISKDDLINYLSGKQPEVLITLGAGDIGLMVPEIEKRVLSR